MKRLSLLLAGIMLAASLAGCGNSAATESTNVSETKNTVEEASVSEAESTTTTNTEPIEIRAWHDNDEAMMNALADVVNEKLKDENITLTFEKKSDVTGQIQLYGTDAANGPDMYLFAHDSLGSFAEIRKLTFYQ